MWRRSPISVIMLDASRPSICRILPPTAADVMNLAPAKSCQLRQFVPTPRRLLAGGLGMFAMVAGFTTVSASELDAFGDITFDRDVMAVLSKAGCNAGTCHGNANGKGGFMLSLRGQAPEFDYQQLVQVASGRRINRVEPEKSLALLKATAQVPHGGGKRFDRESPEYRIFLGWIERGLSRADPSAERGA